VLPTATRATRTHSGRARSAVVASLILAALIASTPGSAAAFGTIDSGGQNREHERITRAALSCADGTASDGSCFESRSIDYLAGHDREFGAVGAPDSDELSDPAAHCDDADFLQGAYPRTREQATATLVDCVEHMRLRFGEAADAARGLLDDADRVVGDEVGLDPECRFFEAAENRAKCETLEGLGRALHGVQDFYAHSNWADEADPSVPVGPANPPGLDLPGPSAVLDLRSDTPPSLPAELTTGCFVPRDQVPGVGACEGRVTHAALNKDTGLIDPLTDAATDPTKPRGKVEENFAKAVTGAIEETRRQWRDLRSELVARHGVERTAVMACALTRDDPVAACQDVPALVRQLQDDLEVPPAGSPWTGLLIGVLALGVGIGAAVLVVRARRRRGT
jgi:hypothetical protein